LSLRQLPIAPWRWLEKLSSYFLILTCLKNEIFNQKPKGRQSGRLISPGQKIFSWLSSIPPGGEAGWNKITRQIILAGDSF
jgi:hypothetical protein